nr:unnamed protein product [Callosobruchus chinensis]
MKETKAKKNIQKHKQMSTLLLYENAATAILKYPKKVEDPWKLKNLHRLGESAFNVINITA